MKLYSHKHHPFKFPVCQCTSPLAQENMVETVSVTPCDVEEDEEEAQAATQEAIHYYSLLGDLAPARWHV